MRSYGPPPSDQMQLELPGLSDGGQRLMEDARRWAALHFSEFCWYKQTAREECARGGKASPNLCLMSMRARFRVEVPNAYAPALARIAMEEDPSIEFRVARSMVDGFCRTRLR